MFVNKTEVKKCRTIHDCQWCPEEIAPGEPAVKYSGKNEDGDMWTAYFHAECHAVCESYREETGDVHWEDYEPQLQERGKPYREELDV